MKCITLMPRIIMLHIVMPCIAYITLNATPLTPTSLTPTSLTPDKLHQHWAGAYMEHKGDPYQALQWYKRLLAEPDTPGYMYKGLVHLLGQTNKFGPIIKLMPKIEPSFKNDIEMQLLFAQALQQAGYQVAADERIIKLFNQAKDNHEITMITTQMYMRRKELENAIKTIQTYLAHAPGNLNNFVFHFLLAQIYLMMDNPNEALVQVQKSLELHPSFDKGWFLFAMLSEKQGLVDKAIEGYATYLELSPTPQPALQKHLLQLLFKQKPLATLRKQTELLFEQKKYKEAIHLMNKGLSRAHIENETDLTLASKQ